MRNPPPTVTATPPSPVSTASAAGPCSAHYRAQAVAGLPDAARWG